MVTDINEDIEMLKLIFSLMASPSDSLTEQQEAKLQRIIEEVWYEFGQEGTVDHVRERCLKCLITGSNEGGKPGERDLSMVVDLPTNCTHTVRKVSTAVTSMEN